MREFSKIFLKKKILIYGLGLTGLSSFEYLKKTNNIHVFDDFNKNINSKKLKNYLINKKQLIKNNYDHIVLSPGINSKKCKLKNFLNKNNNKICTDLDIFYINNFKNKIITVTGTNGKSTTVKLINDILKNTGKDVRLVGNIGKSVLKENKITKKTIFVVEASSYQIEYSKYYKSKYSIILNIKPDHIERHGNFKNYINSKVKLFLKKTKNDFAFYNKRNLSIHNSVKKKNIKCKILNVNPKLSNLYLKEINNKYFLNKNNLENLSFIFALCKKLKIKKKIIFDTINKFRGLKYRQQIIYNSRLLMIINDSKSTSFSSTENLIEYYDDIYWMLGGKPKKNDKFIFKKNSKINIKAYIFGKNKKFFIGKLKNRVYFQSFISIKKALSKVLIDIKNSKTKSKKIILFSPCAASFDRFKNFEDRGNYFNLLIRKLKHKL